jgi:hypothetical protein
MRKLALKISHLVVRYASPGSKEWAEGLAREVAFIENDWSALAWEFGSTKLLLDYREAPIGSLADVPSAAQKLSSPCAGAKQIPSWSEDERSQLPQDAVCTRER